MDVEKEFASFVAVTMRDEQVLRMSKKRAFLAGIAAGVDLHQVIANLIYEQYPNDPAIAHDWLVVRLKELAEVSKKYRDAN